MEEENLNPQATQEIKFSSLELRKYSQELFDVPLNVFDGVFGFFDEKVTKSEAKNRIAKWLKGEAK